MAKHYEPLTDTPTPAPDYEQPSINPATLLGSIVEKNLNQHQVQELPINPSKTTGTKKGSLYAKLKKSKTEAGSSSSSGGNEVRKAVVPEFPQLAGLSEAEILEERAKLIAKMSPETLAFLQKRKVQQELPIPKPTSQTQNPNPNDLPIDPTSVQKFPHMNKLESDKLKWATNVELKEQKFNTEERSARFNFQGEMITIEMEKELKSWDQGLHHHGEEMERPGYTLDELFILVRSTNLQQRAFGLSLISNILKKAHDGEFDLSLSKSIFMVFMELDIIYILRVGLDNPDSSALNSSLHCLGTLLFPDMEETCLDYSYFWNDPSQPQPLIRTKEQNEIKDESLSLKSSKEKVPDSELKDSEYLQLDLIDFLIQRTDILTRIQYVLTNYSELLNESGVFGILKILIRVARHSPNELIQHYQLLGLIFKNFMNPNYSSLRSDKRAPNLMDIPLGSAIKLFRILGSSSKENAKRLYENFSFFIPILAYLSYDSWMDQNKIMEVEPLVLESFKLWHVFLTHGFGADEFSRFLPIIFKCLQVYTSLESFCSFDLTHMAHVFGLISAIACITDTASNLQDLISFVEQLTMKLSSFLSRHDAENLVDFDSALEALGNGLCVLKHYDDKCITTGSGTPCGPLLESLLSNFVKGPGYYRITTNCVSHSLLLSTLGDPSRESSIWKYPENMYHTSSFLFGGNLVPIMTKSTPFPFLTKLFSFIKHHDTDLLNYISKLSETEFPNRTNYFLRFELNFLKELELPCSVIYKIIPQVQTGDEELLNHFLRTFLTHNEYLLRIYISVLVSENEGQILTLNFKETGRKIAPTNWLYTPFTAMKEFISTANSVQDLPKTYMETAYSKVLKDSQEVLEFIRSLLDSQKDLLVGTPEDLRMLYIGVCTVFMLGSNVFLDSQIQACLEFIFKSILSCKLLTNPRKSPLFTSRNEGVDVYVPIEDDFSTFYTQLMNVYYESSYGNPLFGDYLLLPLRPNEIMETKKKFWTNEAIQVIRTKVTSSLIPLEEYFGSSLLPPEDTEMLNLYKRTCRLISPVTQELLRRILDIFLSSKRS